MRSSFRFQAVALLLLCVAGGAYYFLHQEKPKQEVPAPVPASQPADNGVGALGKIEPRSRVLKISHNAGPEGAKIDQLMVDEAQDVKQGDILAILADYPRKKALAVQAEANVKALEAQYRSQQVNLSYAEKNYQRVVALQKAHALSDLDLEQAEEKYKQANVALENMAAQIDSARASNAVAQEDLINMTIRAPISGTVLRVIARSGERLDAAGLLEMADLSQLDVVAEVYERDIPFVKIGQQALITIAGLKQEYHGTIRELGFQVRGNDLNDTDPLADRDNRVVSVRITLDPDSVAALRHQLYRQVQVTIKP